MAGSTLTVKDRKWREILDKIPQLKGAEVAVGIQSDAGADVDGTPIAEYAFYNEVGTNRGIPARPFMRDTADRRRETWFNTAENMLWQTLTESIGVSAALSIVGQQAQADIQKAIRSGGWVANSPLTIEMKGSSQPLIDTGAMIQSIRYEVSL